MNTNPDAKRVLIFGDSLTWGYKPASAHIRFASNVRWPGRLQDLLGNDYEIIEEGLNSRAIENDDPRPGKEGRRGLDYIIPCLDTHDPLDYVFVLLGTNELKKEYDNTPEQIGESIKKLLKIITNHPSQFRAEKPKVILMSPLVVDETKEYCKKNDKYVGATNKSKELGRVYKKVAKELGVDLISLEDIVVGEDGVHVDENGHSLIAEKVFEYLKEQINVT